MNVTWSLVDLFKATNVLFDLKKKNTQKLNILIKRIIVNSFIFTIFPKSVHILSLKSSILINIVIAMTSFLPTRWMFIGDGGASPIPSHILERIRQTSSVYYVNNLKCQELTVLVIVCNRKLCTVFPLSYGPCNLIQSPAIFSLGVLCFAFVYNFSANAEDLLRENPTQGSDTLYSSSCHNIVWLWLFSRNTVKKCPLGYQSRSCMRQRDTL